MAYHITRNDAQQEGTYGITGKNNKIYLSRPHFMQILIGSRYITDNEEKNYGHSALRVFIKGKVDIIYDFGRYGETDGEKRITGEGILRIWKNSSKKYFDTEKTYGKKLKRTTSGYTYYITNDECKNIINFFNDLEKEKRTSIPGKFDEYKLTSNYHAITFNCTTLTLEGAKKAKKEIIYHPFLFRKYIGLSTEEALGARIYIPLNPNIIFMPEDLRAMLKGNKVLKYDKETNNL
jgi:hypothetical protein